MSDYQLSQRRFWALVGTDRNMVRRERPLDHFTSREKMHEIAARRRRFVYQRAGDPKSVPLIFNVSEFLSGTRGGSSTKPAR